MNVDVVVAHFEQPDELAAVLVALDAQVDHRSGDRLRLASVTVADDASTVSPALPPTRHVVGVTVADRDGYHVATARNRGAAAGAAGVVAFLDADTVPAPDYVSRLVDPIADDVADLTTGRRRYADFATMTPAERAAFTADPQSSRLLPEPAWLGDGLMRTDRLRDGSPRTYEYVISAVLAVRRRLVERVGGFDESFDSYGGEDWEFAYRCWNAGARFEHVADAVAFHHGPDIEGRPTRHDDKTAESLRIADLVPASPTRLSGVQHTVPDVHVTLSVGDDLRAAATALWSILASSGTDLVVRLDGPRRVRERLRDLCGDRRLVSTGPDPRSRSVVHVRRPVELAPSSLQTVVADLTDGRRIARVVRSGSDVVVLATSVRARSQIVERGSTSAAPADTVDDTAVGIRPIDASTGLATWARRRRGVERHGDVDVVRHGTGDR